MRIFRKLSDQGDTIIEVLIATAIVSSILAGAYVSSNRSSKVTRSAQEQGQALKFAEAQIELIKRAVDNKSPDVFGAGNFCLIPSMTPPLNLTLGPSCVSVIPGITYTLVVLHTPGSHDFAARVTWDSLSKGSNTALELDYEAQ